MKNTPMAEFFLSSVTPEGERTLREPLTISDPDGLTLYLGRESPDQRQVCRTLQRRAEELGLAPQLLRSSVFPGEPAGLLAPERKLAVYTLPTAGKLLLPGICERWLPCCGEPETVSGDIRQRLWELRAEAQTLQARAARLLRTARMLLRENERLAEPLDRERLERAALGLFRRSCRGAGRGGEQQRFLSSFTGDGFCSTGAAAVLCDRVILAEDPLGEAAGELLAALRRQLLQSGIGFISCLHPLEPTRVQHLLIPSLRLGFLTASPLFPLPGLPPRSRCIHCMRFCRKELTEQQKQRVRLTRRMAAELLKQAEAVLRQSAETQRQFSALWQEMLPPEEAGQAPAALRLGLAQLEGQSG